MARICYLRFECCGRLGYRWLEESSPFLLLALRESLMFPSYQHAVGRKSAALLQRVCLLCGSGLGAGKMYKLLCASLFNDPVSFGAIDQVLVNCSQKKKYNGEVHKNTYLITLSCD